MNVVVRASFYLQVVKRPRQCYEHDMDVDLVFVYGSLKRGFHNHRLLAESEFVGTATTEPRYRLIDCGPYPAMIETEVEPLSIVGELYRIDLPTLARLDRLEDEGTVYRRTAIKVARLEGPACDQRVRNDRAFTYLWIGRSDDFPRWADAVWNKRSL